MRWDEILVKHSGVDGKWIQNFREILKIKKKTAWNIGHRHEENTKLDCDDEDWIFLARN
jgi:hypothetical protein